MEQYIHSLEGLGIQKAKKNELLLKVTLRILCSDVRHGDSLDPGLEEIIDQHWTEYPPQVDRYIQRYTER